jgi:hypothetical protein
MASDYPFGDNDVRPSPCYVEAIIGGRTDSIITKRVIRRHNRGKDGQHYRQKGNQNPVMASDYPFGDNAVRHSPVMSSDYPVGDNAVRPSPCYGF